MSRKFDPFSPIFSIENMTFFLVLLFVAVMAHAIGQDSGRKQSYERGDYRCEMVAVPKVLVLRGQP